MPAEPRELDIVLYGATGYTGGLIAEQLAIAVKPTGLRLALAGRDVAKLATVRDRSGLAPDTPLIRADASDPDTIETMARRTAMIISAVGPYLLHGEPVVAACARNGTDYIDICGEPLWMARMIAAYDGAARSSGARILLSGGFDSIPFDLGVFLVQQRAVEKFGRPAQAVHARVREASGGMSGGTLASAQINMKAAFQDPEVLALITNPFALTGGFEGPPQPRDDLAFEDASLGLWVAPFFMATINTKNIHRTNALLGHPYGADFRYDEMLVTGPGEQGKTTALAVQEAIRKPPPADIAQGDGPSEAERAAGRFDILFIADLDEGEQVRLSVSGKGDPGYSVTSRIVTQAALLLAETEAAACGGGVLTPVAALGDRLAEQLAARGGVEFRVES